MPLARSAALGGIAGDIGHDLANELFAVLGHVDLLLLDAQPGSDEEQRLGVVKHAALELKNGLRALLDFARPPEDRESAALDDAVRAATALVRYGHADDQQIAATYPAEPVLVRCPPAELGQAALQLVAAARAAAGAGPVEVEVTTDGALRVRPAATGALDIVAAGRIAVDHGGSLTQDGDSLVLQLPLWVAS